MRWIYVLIIPALFLLPTFGQAAGESSRQEYICTLASKAKPAKIIKLTIPNTIIKDLKPTTAKATDTTTSAPKETAKSNKSKISKKHTKSTTNSSSQKSTSNTKPTTTTSKSSGNSSATDSGVLSVEREVVRLVNIERSKQGLKPLELSSKLSSVARKKSQDMKDKNYFSHQSPTYGSPFDMLNQFGVSYQTAGENIAAGYPSAQAVVTGWMNSSGHRANILNPSFTKIGVGYVNGGNYGSYWTQLFTG